MSYLFRAIALSMMVAAAALMAVGQYKGTPATKDGLVKALRSHQFQTREFVNLIQNNGVDFQVTPDVEQELVAHGRTAANDNRGQGELPCSRNRSHNRHRNENDGHGTPARETERRTDGQVGNNQPAGQWRGR